MLGAFAPGFGGKPLFALLTLATRIFQRKSGFAVCGGIAPVRGRTLPDFLMPPPGVHRRSCGCFLSPSKGLETHLCERGAIKLPALLHLDEVLKVAVSERLENVVPVGAQL